MKRASRLVLCLLLLLSLFFFNTQPAMACSGGGDIDPIAESEIIVGGWITDWQPTSAVPVNYMTPIKVQMQVDQVFKGNIAADSLFEFVDERSLYDDKEISWGGGGHGTCGAFNVDPKGKYAIIGVVKDKDGRYKTDIFTTLYVGDRPPTTVYSEGIYSSRTGDLQRLIPSFLPTSGGDIHSPSWTLLITGVSLLGLGILMRHGVKTDQKHTS